MTFTYAGQTFRIVFSHHHQPDEKWPRGCHPIMPPEGFRPAKHFLVRAVTHCYIERRVDDKWDTAGRLWGAACCSLEDTFSKEIGRKLSLERSLKPCDKRFKVEAWKAYNNRRPMLEVDKTLAALRWLYGQVDDHVLTHPDNSKQLDIVEQLIGPLDPGGADPHQA